MQRMRQLHGSGPVTKTDANRDPGEHGRPGGGARPWSLMVLLSVAQFMVILDATVVNVALPSIARSLGLAPGDLQWVVTAYVLASDAAVNTARPARKIRRRPATSAARPPSSTRPPLART